MNLDYRCYFVPWYFRPAVIIGLGLAVWVGALWASFSLGQAQGAAQAAGTVRAQDRLDILAWRSAAVELRSQLTYCENNNAVTVTTGRPQ